MSITFTTTQEASVGNGVKFLIHAPPGYGKTLLCATMPKPCVISVESGLLSLNPENIARHFGENTPGISYNIPVIQLGSVQDLNEVKEFFRTSIHAKDLNPCLDSLSEMAELVLSQKKKGCKDARQAYGETQEIMTDFIRFFRDLPGRHVYFTAKQTIDKDTDGIVRRMPMMPGATLQTNVGHFFDEVFALDIGEMNDHNKTKYRFLRTQPDIRFQAKDRSGSLDEIEEPNLNTVIQKIIKNHV